MQLHDERGQEFYATLMRLDEKTATLAVGGETRTVVLGALAVGCGDKVTVNAVARGGAGDT